MSEDENTENSSKAKVSSEHTAKLEMPLEHDWISSVLPHRFPMLLVDRVLEIEPEKRIVAIKNVTRNEAFFDGHFPKYPIMPGVLVIEAMAQAAGLLLMHGDPELQGKVIYFTGIERARFRRPIVPGDQIVMDVEILRRRSFHARFTCKARVDGAVAVEAIASSMLARQ